MTIATTGSVADRLERLGVLDGAAPPLARAAALVAPGPSRLKDVLSGTWLGHPLHPVLTDVVVGAWTSAFLLDRLGGRAGRSGADALVLTGALAAVPTAATGLSDWQDTRGAARRLGTIHALGNTVALVLHVLSWRSRRRGRRGRGKALSALGLALAGSSAWVGGHLTYARGIGVDHTAFDVLPAEWTPVAAVDALAEGQLVAAEAGAVQVVLVRRGGTVHALDDRCTHRGCALHEGELDGDTIRCRCHGSTFALDGSIVRGPATRPQPALDVRVSDGHIEVRALS